MNTTRTISHSLALSRRSVLKTTIGAAAAAAGLFPIRAMAASSVNFLGWQGYDDPVIFDDFAKSKGITLNTTYIGNNDEILTKLRTGGVGQIDIVTPYMGYIPLLAKLDLIQPIDTARVPNLEKILPLFKNDPNLSVDGKLYAVPFTWGSLPMMYDPAAIPVAPVSWKDLLKPEFTGKVGMMDDPLGNITIAAIVATDAAVPTQLSPTQLEQAIDFLIEIKKQSRVVSVSWGDLADAMARGDVTITFSGWEALQKFAADKGKAISYVYPVEGTSAWLDSYCIAKDAPNLDAAYELCNRVIDMAPQMRLAENALQAIVNTEAIAALPESLGGIYPYDTIDNFGEKASFFVFPPVEADGVLATYSDWLVAYERFKTA